jgi:flavorubredoxin
MKTVEISPGVSYLPSIDWHRRLFDSLIPLPDGTSYNSYLVKGHDKTALIDTADPSMSAHYADLLADVPKIDYLISSHAEQDHSGLIPAVLEKYKDAVLVVSAKGKQLIMDHLHVSEKRIRTVADGETIALGGKMLKFVYTPWVHWPETMVTYLAEEQIVFSCDFFGAHLATTDVFVSDNTFFGGTYEAAKRYYAEIMMPFRQVIAGNLEKIAPLPIKIIAPSHGPIYRAPALIMDAYRDWVGGPPHNLVVIPFISMHGSTAKMVECLTAELMTRKIKVLPFDLAVTDIGQLAIALVDAATLVIGTPTVHLGPHPVVNYAVSLANALRPKAKFASIIGSYGWGSKAVERIAQSIPNLKVEVLNSVLCHGLPRDDDYKLLARLAEEIDIKHREINIK